ncbi:MAG: uroporphyrinogen-III synthase [Chloroflexota bacterium]|nr:uroporphyrinogen-III synthase [Chloroflexota bacterium]
MLVTRPAGQSEALCRYLAAAGLRGVCIPLLATRPLEDTSALDAALNTVSAYDWVVFASANAVRFFVQRALALGIDLAATMRAQLCAGPATAAMMADCGLRTHLILDPFSAHSAASALAPRVQAGDRILLPGAVAGRDTLATALRQHSAMIDEVALYRTEPDAERAAEALRRLGTGEFRAVALFSPSAVQALHCAVAGHSAAAQRTIMDGVTLACIGATTAAAVAQAGWHADVIAPSTTSGALATALAEYLAIHEVRR